MRLVIWRHWLAAIVSLAISGGVQAQSLTAGNFVVLRAGDGSPVTSANASGVTLFEYTPTGVLQNTIVIPNTGASALTLRGTSTTEGVLNFSADGQFLVFAGHRANAGDPNPNTGTIERVIGRVAANGLTVNTATQFNDGYAGDSLRSAASANGTTFYTSGASSTAANGSVRFIGSFGGVTTSASLTAAGGNTRQVQVLANPLSGALNLFVSAGAATPGQSVFQVGAGTPTTGAQTFSTSFPVNAAQQYQNFYFARLGTGATWNPNGGGAATDTGFDTLYATDTSGSNFVKFSFNGSSWSTVNSLSQAAITGLSAVTVGSTVSFFATTNTASTGQVLSFTDASGFGGTMTGAFAGLTNPVVAGTGFGFRGIAVVLSPVPEPTGLLLVGFAALGVGRRWVRRRKTAS